jgi:hypothetical protein
MKVVVLLYVYVYNYVAHFLYFRKYDTEVRKYEGIFPYEYKVFTVWKYGRKYSISIFPYRTEVRKYSIRRYRYFRTKVLSYEDTILSYEGTFVRRYFHRA